MREFRSFLLIAVVVVASASLGACTRAQGNLHIETGRARLVDEQGKPRPRILAANEAQREARLKLLHAVEAVPFSGDTLIGDYLAVDPIIGARIQSRILSVKALETRYPDDVVEVDIGIDFDEIKRLIETPAE
jgi:hypothetical protein